MKECGTPVKYLRCDNADENAKYVKELCNKYGVTPEFTAPNTPQQNGFVEQAFTTVKAKGLDMLEAANFTNNIQNSYGLRLQIQLLIFPTSPLIALT